MNAFCFFETSGRVIQRHSGTRRRLDPQQNLSDRRKFRKIYLFVYLGQLQCRT